MAFSKNLFIDPYYPETSVYDSIRTYHKKPFRLEQHLQRLKNSAELLDFELPESLECITKKVLQEVEAAEFDPQFLKVIATPKNIFLENRPLIIDDTVYKGVKVISVSLSRDLVKCKRVRNPGLEEAYGQALSQENYEALLCRCEPSAGPSPRDPHRYLTEGTRSNILWFKKGTLFYCDHALSGITQTEVIRLADQLSIRVSQGVLPYDSLKEIDELFLTQTTRGIVPVLMIDQVSIGNGKSGEKTKLLMEHFQSMTFS